MFNTTKSENRTNQATVKTYIIYAFVQFALMLHELGHYATWSSCDRTCYMSCDNTCYNITESNDCHEFTTKRNKM
jgi:hypothetical protein